VLHASCCFLVGCALQSLKREGPMKEANYVDARDNERSTRLVTPVYMYGKVY